MVQATVVNLSRLWVEQCLVDPCVFRLMLNDAVVAMLVVHVDDIKIAATEEVAYSVVADLNKRFPTKHLLWKY